MQNESPHSDQVFNHSKQEAKELLIAFVVFMTWSLGVSYYLGFGAPTPEVETVWGIPSWVFWGVAAPWGGANLYTIYFCVFRMADDPLVDSDSNTDAPDGYETAGSDSVEGEL